MADSAGKKKDSRRPDHAGLDHAGLLRVLHSVALGVFAVDRDWRITFFNREAERITGYPRDEALGRPCREIFRSDRCAGRCYLRAAMDSGQSLVKARLSILNKRRRRIPLEITAAVQRDEQGRIVGGVESFLDLSARQALEHNARQQYRFHDLVGRSPAMRNLFDTVAVVARTNATVLLRGETGTGKSLLAQVIHNAGPKSGQPYVKVNCAAIPDTLLESELFGYRRGAFTDAHRDKPGLFAQAGGGTLFLDEIGDIPAPLQAKLFQVLDEGAYLPLGATEPEKVDVRILAATNQDIDAKVAAGEFRSDLYYRLRVVELTVPALRHRREDLPLLIDHFMALSAALHSSPVECVDQETMRLLLNHDYPGNVRELRHIIEHGVILTTADTICLGDLPAHLRAVPCPDRQQASPSPSTSTTPTNTQDLHDRERALLRSALAEHGGCRAATARTLGIDRTTLWRRMKRLGLA